MIHVSAENIAPGKSLVSDAFSPKDNGVVNVIVYLEGSRGPQQIGVGPTGVPPQGLLRRPEWEVPSFASGRSVAPVTAMPERVMRSAPSGGEPEPWPDWPKVDIELVPYNGPDTRKGSKNSPLLMTPSGIARWHSFHALMEECFFDGRYYVVASHIAWRMPCNNYPPTY